MKDQLRKCGRCNHEHAYGIVGYSPDNVPLYGARKCGEIDQKAGNMMSRLTGAEIAVTCSCVDFVEANIMPACGECDGGLFHASDCSKYDGQMRTSSVPSLPKEEVRKLWQDTEFLSPQTPMATRIAVRQIDTLEGAERDKAFMGLMISQVTDIRAAMTKDESKFAHLVSHTDEVVESMRGVVQLKERLEGVNRRIDDTNERIDKMAAMIAGIAEKLGVSSDPEPVSELASAARRVFTQANSTLKDEAVVVDGVPADDR